jgi:predicted DNA-binding WGR domain protein
MNSTTQKTTLKAVSTNGAPRQFAFYTVTFTPGESEWTAHWGRIGTKGQKRTYRTGSWAARERFASKIAKGYRRVES